jgi:hypothetical protein
VVPVFRMWVFFSVERRRREGGREGGEEGGREGRR